MYRYLGQENCKNNNYLVAYYIRKFLKNNEIDSSKREIHISLGQINDDFINNRITIVFNELIK